MYWRGHVGLGLLAYAPFAAFALGAGEPDLALVGGVLAAALATLPDVDQLLPIPHRGPTHTLAFTVVVGVVAGGGAALVNATAVASSPEWTPLFVGGVATASLWSHLAGDVITPMGIRPFRPLSGAHFTLDLTPAKNPRVNVLFLSVGVLALSTAVMLSI